ncbi:MAG: DUF2721 domain-containing protein [Bryobacteraceae bacterium]|nr:DUF2721 domain-containing protein [Bryobacteraceae bacterium]
MNFAEFLTTSRFTTLSAALAVLTAMITPALLISATGTFILSTSNRLGRCVDRMRGIMAILEEDSAHLSEERKSFLLSQIDMMTKRSRVLARVLVYLYFASGMFMATSVSIAVASVAMSHWSWLPLVLGITGALFQFVASLMLIGEARLSRAGLEEEAKYMVRLAKRELGPGPE